MSNQRPPCAAGCSRAQGPSGASPARSSARQTPGATDNTSPRSPRSGGLRPPCSGPARPEHRPAAASQRSLQAYIASLPLQSSWMSKTYLKSDHFNGGGSNFGSITPLANQMTALNQSANSECPNSWMLFGAHKSPSRAPRRQHRLRADISSSAKRFCQFCMVFVALLSRFVPARDLLVCAKNLFVAGGWAGDVRLITSNLFYNARLRACMSSEHFGQLAWQFKSRPRHLPQARAY